MKTVHRENASVSRLLIKPNAFEILYNDGPQTCVVIHHLFVKWKNFKRYVYYYVYFKVFLIYTHTCTLTYFSLTLNFGEG